MTLSEDDDPSTEVIVLDPIVMVAISGAFRLGRIRSKAFCTTLEDGGSCGPCSWVRVSSGSTSDEAADFDTGAGCCSSILLLKSSTTVEASLTVGHTPARSSGSSNFPDWSSASTS